MVRPTQLVVPTITSFEITSQYLSEATHQVKVEAHTHRETQKTKVKSANTTNIISHNGCRETQRNT